LALVWRTASPLTEAFCRIAAEQALNLVTRGD
jgi:hypothetical protein